MKTVTLAVAALLVSAGAIAANAQQDAASSTSAASPPITAPPPSDAPAVDMHELCNRRDVREAGRFYPPRALELHISGSAVLDCAFDNEDKPSSCQIVEETQPLYHFGDASLRIMCRARLTQLAGANGASSDMIVYERNGETRLRQTVRFRLAEDR